MDQISTVINTFKEILSLSSQNIFKILSLGIFCLFSLYLPQTVIDIFYLQKSLMLDQKIIGPISFVIIGIGIWGVFHLFFFNVFIWLKKFLKNLFLKKYKLLKGLTPVEYGYLRDYIEGLTQTAYFLINDGVVKGLEAKGIISLVASRGLDGYGAYNIQPWAYNWLSGNLNFLYMKLQMLEKGHNSRPFRRKFRSPDEMKWS